MNRIWVSLVERGSCSDALSRIYIVDWDSGSVVDYIDLDIDPAKAHGNSRGARGMDFLDGKLYVAGTDGSVSVYAQDSLDLVQRRVVPELHNPHYLRIRDGFLYIASTLNDTRVCLRPDLEVESVLSLKHPSLGPLEDWGRDRLHFNSFCWLPNGDEIHVYNHLSAIWNFTRKEMAYKSPLLTHPHDVVPFRYSLMVNSSNACATYQLQGAHPTRVFSVPKNEVSDMAGWTDGITVRWGFTRGMVSHHNSLFVGYAPMRIVELSHQEGRFYEKRKVSVGNDPYKSTYDLRLDPRDWIHAS